MLQLNTKIANKLQWKAKTYPFFETYEIILHDKALNCSFWIQYQFSNTKEYGSNLDVQIASWGPENQQHFSHNIPLHQYDVIHSDCFFSVNKNSLGLSESKGDFLDKKASIHWNLHLLDNTIGRLQEIRKFYDRNPKSQWLIPTLCGRVEGPLMLDLKKFSLKHGYFCQFHHFGAKPFKGKWLQALHFEGCPSLRIYYFEKDSIPSLNPFAKKSIVIIYYEGRIYTQFQKQFSKPLLNIQHTDLCMTLKEQNTDFKVTAKVNHDNMKTSIPKAFDLQVEVKAPHEKNRIITQTFTGTGLQHRLF